MPEDQTSTAKKAAQLRTLGWVSIIIGLLASAFMVFTMFQLWSPILAGSMFAAVWPIALGAIVLNKAKKLKAQADETH